MKKHDAAATAELRLAGTGWLPEVLTKRDASDDDQTEEQADTENDKIPY